MSKRKKPGKSFESRLGTMLRHHEVSSYREHPEGEWVEFQLRATDKEWENASTYITAKELAAVEALIGGTARVTGYDLGRPVCERCPEETDSVLYVLVERPPRGKR